MVCSALRNVHIKVPSAVVRGEDAILQCFYDLEGDKLYSVKWYRGGWEFFRYCPSEFPPIKQFKIRGLNIREKDSRDTQVVLEKVTKDITGVYSCEVTADQPSFFTDMQTAELRVVDLPKKDPQISGLKTRYKLDDTLRANCTSEGSHPAANLTWFINGIPVEEKFIRHHRPTLYNEDKLVTGPRTHPTQWAAIVEFIENHPEMVTHKFVGINGKENYIKLWEELTTQLNSMGFGKKDSKKWQEVFGKWKSKVKGKAQDIVCGMKKTGGGGPLPELNQIEERLMAIIGWKLVTGDENKEMGVENIFTSHDDITKEITEDAKNPENVFPNSNDITIKLTEEAEKISENKKYTTFSSTLPTMLKDVDLEMPPLTLLSKPSSTSMNKTVSNCNVSLISPVLRTNKDIVNETTPKTFAEKGTKRKLKHSSSPKKVPRQNQPHLVNMHNENIDVLKNINSNLTRTADSQEKQLELFAEILKVLKQK